MYLWPLVDTVKCQVSVHRSSCFEALKLILQQRGLYTVFLVPVDAGASVPAAQRGFVFPPEKTQRLVSVKPPVPVTRLANTIFQPLKTYKARSLLITPLPHFITLQNIFHLEPNELED